MIERKQSFRAINKQGRTPRSETKHGGPRDGAGRKPAAEPVEAHTITLFRSDVEYLRTFDPKLTLAIRKLIQQTKGV